MLFAAVLVAAADHSCAAAVATLTQIFGRAELVQVYVLEFDHLLLQFQLVGLDVDVHLLLL